jgi:hypothetical protein
MRTKQVSRLGMKAGDRTPKKHKRFIPLPPPCKHEMAWRKNEAMELYPDMKEGMKKIGNILKFGKRVWNPRKKDDVGVMKEGHSSTPIANEVPTESDDLGVMNEEDSSTPIADEVPTESDDVGVMKERDSSTPIAGKVPTNKKKKEVSTWSTLDNKWQSVEEIKNLQEQFEKELNKYVFDTTQNCST